MATTTEWLAELSEGDLIYLSTHADALPVRVLEIDRADQTVLVARPDAGSDVGHGMPMFFGASDLDAIAQVRR